MGLRINTNVESLKAQNALSSTTKKLNQSLVRLSTGLRINTGKDDVVGLAKSEALRAKIRGVDVALNNITNASSVLGVAEGGLAQLTEIAQSMREIAVQSADATISTADRTALGENFNTLTAEYNRIAINLNFNGVKLLDGTFTSKNIQVGSDEGETISVSVSDSRSATIGKAAIFTSITFTDLGTATSAASATFTDPGGNLAFIVGTSTHTVLSSAFTTDGVSNVEASESAIAYVNAINSISGQTGITATVLTNYATLNYATSGGELQSAINLVINGTTISAGILISESDDTDASTLVGKINEQSTVTGVSATIDTANDRIILSATDGRNINVRVTGSHSTLSTYNVFGLTGGGTVNTQNTYRGTYKLTSDSEFTITDGTTGTQVAGATSKSVTVDSNTALTKATVNTVANASNAISILDRVISQLQTRRASVGSTTNRLDITSAELASRKENLASAESNIRNADIAVETAKLTQQQILQSAGATVLAQANSAPQIALQLLQSL